MKRIGILTLYYKNYNYGGLLQAYALCYALKGQGYECEQISFVRDRKKLIFRKIRGYFEEPVTKDIFSVATKKIINKISGKRNDNLKYTIKKFDDFMGRIPHSSVVNGESIKTLSSNYDVWVVGSDQVWNPLFTTKEFFFDFLDEKKPRISYAASIRINKFEKKEGRVIKKLLEKFDYISVREKRAVETIRRIGFKKNIEVLPDPTFLLSKEEWNMALKPVKINYRYIMVYLVRDATALSRIKEYAIKEKLKVVLVSEPGFESIEDSVFVNLKEGIGPSEFIWLIKNANLVVANSFHGTAFSIIFNKPFYVYGDIKVDDRKGTLLKKFKLEKRIVNNEKEFSTSEVIDIDFKYANSLMEKERTETIDKINNVISQII